MKYVAASMMRHVAADGISPPWQVFEWYLVEGLVRTAEDSQRLGLPGRLKAERAIADAVPLSANRYLKTPTVFGFHGVYRLLARTLGIESGGRLGETGYELLSIWSREQGLDGFIGSGGGPGQSDRTRLIEAVKAGLEKGATARNSTWAGWSFFARHLAPSQVKPQEAVFIKASLFNDPKGFRREIMEFLVSLTGRKVWEASGSEREFYRRLRNNADAELAELLDAIDAFENFSRLCQDAFQDCLVEMTRQGGSKTSPKALASLPSVQLAANRVPEAFTKAVEKLVPLDESARCIETFASLVESDNAEDWVERLLEHHCTIQRRKPPNGKQPWFERFNDGSVIIRPLYRTDEPGAQDESYVHLFRVRSLWQFALDLNLVKQ
ncbi:MAG: hypothetical protein IPM55_16375 [Acidobacteria bacterium]|nr:hypothetical protein [Acidobacteriota bacterium]